MPKSVDTNEAAIGRALTAMRGEMAQATLAEKMRARGWKWSQATVWSVERGERPLRLAEAVDVVELLDGTLDGLLHAERAQVARELRSSLKQQDAAWYQIFVSARELFQLQRSAQERLTAMGEKDAESHTELVAEVEHKLYATPEDAVELARGLTLGGGSKDGEH